MEMVICFPLVGKEGCEKGHKLISSLNVEPTQHWGSEQAGRLFFLKFEEIQLYNVSYSLSTLSLINLFIPLEAELGIAQKEKRSLEHWNQVAQRGGRCPISGNIQGQAGWDSEQPDRVEDVPAQCRWVGLDDL